MKKWVLKLLSGLCIGIGMLSTFHPVSASDASHAVDNAFNIIELKERNRSNSISNLTVYIADPIVTYANSSQWDYRSPFWVLATPDFEQGYCNAWANVNGIWYYIDKQGHMVTNHMILDLNTNKKYYVNESGALLTNGYYTDYYNNQAKYYAGNDGSLTLVK